MTLDYPSNSIDLFINYFIVSVLSYYITVYVFCKSQNTKLQKSQLVYAVISGIAFSAFFSYVRTVNYPLAYILRFSLVPLLLSFLIKNRKYLFKTLVIGLVSLSFVSVVEVVASLIHASFFWIIKIIPNGVLAYLPVEFITFLLCVLFMNIKRFKRGFQFFQEEKNLGMGLTISVIVLTLKCMNLRDHIETDYFYIIIIIGSALAGFGLYLWISRSITTHYRSRQQLRSEEHYQEVLEERDKEIKKLNQSNAYLAKIVHRDNHLMSNVNTSIDMYFNSNDETYKETLLRELQTLAKERNETINKEQLESKLLPSTGNLLIDGAINDLYIKAAAHGIDFNMTISSTVDEIIGKYISQTDLQTLLCDHIKDAIIAVDSYGESGGKILVNLSKQNDNYCIDIYDSGVAFEPDTLSKLGMERVTTHEDSGGSGIGFMTTFETIRKAYASLIITEFGHRSPFSKSVSFRFDGESAFIINSYRKDELQQLIKRNDVIYL